MFATDGCKLPSNAFKEWSGTKADFEKKAAKMEQAVAWIISRHQISDSCRTEQEMKRHDAKHVETLKKYIKKIRCWLDDNDDNYFVGRSEEGKHTFTEKMKRKIDSAVGLICNYK